MSERDRQKAATRARIVGAVTALVAERHPAAISVPAVAERAGVGVATVYRYFPTKEALLDASAYGAVSSGAASLPGSLAEVTPALRAAWGELADQLPLVRNQLASPLGRDLRRRRWEAKAAALSEAAVAERLDPTDDSVRRLLGVVDVLTSSTALLELHDKAGVAVEDAADWCGWAVAVLHQATLGEVG
ncbi:MAG TPA: TetR/AcrR family transcriptional regulator [Acidimicrobiales bacterium]|nr:TetR/AcrR family transcriptional regulator [Acidimicrobiales bacterium]